MLLNVLTEAAHEWRARKEGAQAACRVFT
jgi:hypothetical protein